MKENQTQPKSFRITEETANKLKEIASSNGKNQQETLSMLIQVYELQEGKETLAGKRDDIDKFQGLLTTITRMYMSALEDENNAMTIARSQFEAQLNSKDQVILGLQNKNKELQKACDLFYSEKDNYELQLENLQRKNDELENGQILQKEAYDNVLQGKDELLREKNESIFAFQDELKEIKSKYDTLLAENQTAAATQDALREKLKSLTKSYDGLEGKLSALETYNEELQAAIEKMRVFYEEEKKKIESQSEEKYALELEKAIFNAKKETEIQYDERLWRCQNDLDQYRDKYYALLEKQAEKRERDE